MEAIVDSCGGGSSKSNSYHYQLPYLLGGAGCTPIAVSGSRNILAAGKSTITTSCHLSQS